MSNLFQLVFIIVVGTLCQVIGWRVKLPSIILLLIAGILAGPVFNIISPDSLLGPSLLPFVELAVAIILFEGGLTLKRREIGQVGAIVMRLVTIGTFVTWVLVALLAYYLLGLDKPIAALLGAILVVSGPTVVIPLLRIIRVRAPVEPVLRWEGILIDPVGVVLAVLVAEVCEAGFTFNSSWHLATGMLISLSVGITFGFGGAILLKQIVGRHLVPDQFIVPLSLTVLFLMVVSSNAIHEQSGLLTSTIMGLVVATYHKPWVKTIEDFIGHTQRMFIGVLFILLAARLDPAYVDKLDLNLSIFILTIILLVRPLAVFIATYGINLNFREKLAIGFLAPRGIVSAALASTLGASLLQSGMKGVENIISFTFAVIIGTVAFYGLFSPVIFRLLKVEQTANEGVLFVGGGKVVFALAKVIKELGFKVAFVDTNEANIRFVGAIGIDGYLGNILSDTVKEDINLEGIGNLVAFTQNDEANYLASIEYRHILGAAHVFQVATPNIKKSSTGGRILISKELSLEKFNSLWDEGYRFYVRELSRQATDSKAVKTSDAKDLKDQEVIYKVAEIENQKLFLVAHDKLRLPLKASKQIVFGMLNKQL